MTLTPKIAALPAGTAGAPKWLVPRDSPGYRLLSVVVPVYNERNTVGEIIRRMRLVDLPIEREIIIVNDGSEDGTDKVIAALEDSTVRVVGHAANRGKGAAIRTGLAVARGDLVLIQDADLEYNPQDWLQMVNPILEGRARTVYGSRYIGEREAASIARWAGDRSLALLCALLFNRMVSDVETGYKAMDRSLLESLELRSDGFDIEPEITAKLLRRGERILEVPITYTGRRRHEGRKFRWRDGMGAAWTLVRLRIQA